jgi:hypothetical protein
MIGGGPTSRGFAALGLVPTGIAALGLVPTRRPPGAALTPPRDMRVGVDKAPWFESSRPRRAASTEKCSGWSVEKARAAGPSCVPRCGCG